MPLVVPNSDSPRVILGLMTFGPDQKAGARVTSLDEYTAIMDKLQASGHNELDTARVYVGGKQEAFTREAGWRERGFSIATKCYPSGEVSHKPDVLRRTFELSLKELGADCVDIFYLHAADRGTPFQETLEECDKLHKEGKYVRLGLSNFTAFEVAEVVMIAREKGWVRPTVYQGMYNAITRGIEAELIPAIRRYGMDLVTYNPIAGGLFSGKYTAEDLKAGAAKNEGRFSDASGIMGQRYRERYFRDGTFAALSIIEPAVKKHNLTMLETALRWMVHHSQLRLAGGKDGTGARGNDGIIIGVSSAAQLDGNLEDLQKGPLPDEVVQALDEAWTASKSTTPNYWQLDLKYTYDTEKALFG